MHAGALDSSVTASRVNNTLPLSEFKNLNSKLRSALISPATPFPHLAHDPLSPYPPLIALPQDGRWNTAGSSP